MKVNEGPGGPLYVPSTDPEVLALEARWQELQARITEGDNVTTLGTRIDQAAESFLDDLFRAAMDSTDLEGDMLNALKGNQLTNGARFGPIRSSLVETIVERFQLQVNRLVDGALNHYDGS